MEKRSNRWLVLAVEGDKALVINKYALDCKEYNTSYASVTWETCSLRNWLNRTFLYTAFSSEEKNSIISSTVTADKNTIIVIGTEFMKKAGLTVNVNEYVNHGVQKFIIYKAITLQAPP